MGIFEAAMAVLSLAMSAMNAAKARAAQKKAKKKQRAAQLAQEMQADLAKGVQLVIAGEIRTLHVVYGRALVGGIRCYHNTVNTYTAAEPAAGGVAFSSSAVLDSNVAAQVLESDKAGSGGKHEFLITQQALCFAGINAVYQVEIDERKIDGEWLNALNEEVVEGTAGARFENPYSHGCKVHVYVNGGVNDPLVTANDAARADAMFTGVAFATGVFRLNRDEPQYGGPPDVKFYVEGMRVCDVLNTNGTYSLSSYKLYSNNPALCVLDYLTSTVYGKGVTVAELDLKSFYEAKVVCEKVAIESVPLEGMFWKKRGGIRAIKQFECNISLDSAVPLRENIEKLLDSIPDSELVWSGGVYKLRIRYPEVFTQKYYTLDDTVQLGTNLYKSLDFKNGSVPPSIFWKDDIDAYVTDADLVRVDGNAIVWPAAASRLNFATVSFLNEAKDFKEDTVEWPAKDSALYATYLAQDSGVLLEQTVTAITTTSYYHAQAVAEQTVRSSRSAVTYTLFLNRDYLILEPGDIIKVTSRALRIPGELLKVQEVEPDSSGNSIKITADKFDAGTFAWNVPDTAESVAPRNIFSNSIEQATDLVYASDTVSLAVGNLTWVAAVDTRVISYDIVWSTGTISETTVWTKLLNTNATNARIPYFEQSDFNLAVVAVSYLNTKAPKLDWPTVRATAGNNSIPGPMSLELKNDSIILSWVPSTDPKQVTYDVFVGGTDILTAVPMGSVSSTSMLLPAYPLGDLTIWLRCTDIYGRPSTNHITNTFQLIRPASPIEFLITGDALSWSPAPRNELSYPTVGYAIRVHNGLNLNWNTALQLHTGLVTTNPYTPPYSFIGQKTVMIEAVDSQGNLSISSTNIFTDFGDLRIDNVIEAFEYGPTFDGPKENCSVVAGAVEATALDSFYGGDDQSFYFDEDSSFYKSGVYAPMTYTTVATLLDNSVLNSMGVIEYDIEGTDVKIQYRSLSSEPFYDADGDSFYLVNGEPFYGISSPSEAFKDYLGSFRLDSNLYEIKVNVGAGMTQGKINVLRLSVDVPDLVDSIEDMMIAAVDAPIVFTKPFIKIKSIVATLQANASTAVTLEIDKTSNLVPKITAYNSSHVAVTGAKADIQIKGY